MTPLSRLIYTSNLCLELELQYLEYQPGAVRNLFLGWDEVKLSVSLSTVLTYLAQDAV